MTSGPVLCAPCSISLQQPCSDPKAQAWYLNQPNLDESEREDFQNRALVNRLVLALSHGEHVRYFGEQKNISLVYLRLKFNIDKALAEKLFGIAVNEQILLVDPDDGSVQFNECKDYSPDLKPAKEQKPHLKAEKHSDEEEDSPQTLGGGDSSSQTQAAPVEMLEISPEVEPEDSDCEDEDDEEEESSSEQSFLKKVSAFLQ